MTRRRVFITGRGLVSPLGEDAEQAFERAFSGDSAVRLERSGTEEYGADVVMARADFDAEGRIPRVARLVSARVSQLAYAATESAIDSAGLRGDAPRLSAAGAYMGCGLGGAEVLEEGYRVYHARRRRRIKPASIPMVMANGPASHMSMHFGLRGPTYTFSIACASATVALGEAYRTIRHGYADRILGGGAEAMLNDGSVAGWERLSVMASPHPSSDAASSRPFDRERTGFVLGEGAVVLVLESEEAMDERGAEPLAEIVGYGASSDAHDLTEPHVEGLEAAMRGALEDAGVDASEVGYLNAHATGTIKGDPVELHAIARVFGDGAPGLSVSSTKGVHGHLVGAAGALECLITAEALRQGRVPPTAFLDAPDPDLGIDLVPRVGRVDAALEIAMSNSFAFGGSNGCLVLRKAG